jgi:hypothetical protein
MAGLRWLCHRSRHCFPILPGRCSAIKVHFEGPCLSTNFFTKSSSSFVHGLLFLGLGIFGFKTFYHLWIHSYSSLPMISAIFFQSFF